MKAENKPVFISSFIENGLLQKIGIETHPAQRHSKMSNLKLETESSSPQQDSGICNLSMGLIGPMGLMGRKPVMKNTPAQRDSETSILKTSPTQQGSKNSKLVLSLCLGVSVVNWLSAQRHSKMSNLKLESESSSAQRHSKMSNLGMGLMGPMGPIGLIGKKPVMENSSVQRDSGISNLGVMRILGWKTKNENSSAQRDSKMSNLGRCPINPLRPTNILNLETSSAQRHSKMSNLGRCPINPQCPTKILNLENSSAQRHSKMSNLKIETETSSPQQDSGISKLGMGLMGVMGLMGREHKSKNCPAQQDSGISTLKTSPYRPLAVRLVPLCGDPYRPLDFKTSSAQPGSGISKLGMGLIGPMGTIGLMGRKPVMKNALPQRDSIISKFIEES